MHALARDEPDIESEKADTYEFLREKCYLKNQDCDGPVPIVIENDITEESDIYEAVESVPMTERRHA